MSNVNKTLEDRGAHYGKYSEGVKLRATIMNLIKDRHLEANGDCMPRVFESMMWDLVNKLSRLAVSPDHIDTIHDIGGYAKLYEDYLIEEKSHEI